MKNSKICESKVNYNEITDIVSDLTNINRIGFKTKSLFNKIINLSSTFNVIENQYNINNKYYYGYLPYLIVNTFINYVNYNNVKITNNHVLNDFIDEFTNNYIMNTYDFNYIDSDIAKIHILIACTFAVITNYDSDLNDLIDAYNNFIHYFNINNYYSNSSESDVIKNKKILKNINKAYIPFVNNILINFMNTDEEIKSNKLSELRDIFEMELNKVYKKFNFKNITYIKDYNLDILINYLESDIIDVNNYKSPYFQDTITLSMIKNYIYTSLYIYTNNLIPPIESNDDGNGRLSEFLLSKVYSVLEIFLILQNEIICKKYIKKITNAYNEFSTILNKHNLYDFFKKSGNENTGFMLLNIINFRIKYFNKFCSEKYIRTKNNNKTHKFCYINYDKYNEITDIYNKLNIKTDYILVKIDEKNITYNEFLEIINFIEDSGPMNDIDHFKTLCIKMIQSFNFLFKPLQPLCYYYSNMLKTTNPRNYEIMNKNIYNKDIIINNCNIGGDLYCILNHNFYLVDSKRYHNVRNIKCLITKTLIQSYLYINVYYQPLCTINNTSLYQNYFIGIINPIDNFHEFVYYFDFANLFANNNILENYLFTDPIDCKLNKNKNNKNNQVLDEKVIEYRKKLRSYHP